MGMLTLHTIVNGSSMNHETEYDYGNWITTGAIIVFFLVFVLGFLMPFDKANWRSMGVFAGFIVALFTEMYGFPLTIYLLSSWLNLPLSFGHIHGHLLAVLISSLGIMSLEYAWGFVMLISNALIFSGLILISKGWSAIHSSSGELVTGGVYRYCRHPQYLGIYILTIGFMVQWPTLITLIMWPILMVMYYRLAKREEKTVLGIFPNEYALYMQQVPMILPRLHLNKSLRP